ncbi:Putative fatty acyl-coenzyme A reductase, NAD-binding domain, NAD(P)-binding domain superfamily [Septoria linicola]|uniref:Fatty acyl-coenzyme A reductase, NAD-binding domain, NAD(P)-binding domain superfamily n=1 Tax=Septoria linicola TaxID=215465 RepID=A0A9Q9ENP4_9PEZI|nr:putative fatty acyl-coenzyme A reductase, NAD-binding domain, NAD(P)-binding domain superfamily [Septoria linicola]USW56819.1 Putative fatty acyl-coenzyme A reductase, NAD-binding domain, NAD(P)-binding domain superfamily [Septoria linicola]
MAKVLLTGSTGNLGTYILDRLIKSQQVEQIWCLNRSDDVSTRQKKLLGAKGLSIEIPAYVSFFQSNTAAHDLGLTTEDCADIASNVTHIIHAAWPVDWNKSFSSFKESIRGVRNLIDLASAAANAPLLFYISSVAAAGNWGAVPGARDTVPEQEIEDWKVARMGYGQSKLVSERLLAEATRSSGATTAVCRVGQVAGPVENGTNGVWPKQEWLPSMITSSKFLGCLPKTLGPANVLDWVPVDELSTIIVELLLNSQPAGSLRFHHVTNPNTAQWQTLLPTVQQALQDSKESHELDLVDLPDWVERLERSAGADMSSLDQNPAVKLLPFFQNLKDKALHLPKAKAVRLETKHSSTRSQTLAQMEPVSAQWMSLWMQQWQLC